MNRAWNQVEPTAKHIAALHDSNKDDRFALADTSLREFAINGT